MKDVLVEDIIKVIADTLELDASSITIKTNLVRDLELESLDFVDIIVAFEEKYHVEIKDQDVKNLQTIEDIYNYIKNHV